MALQDYFGYSINPGTSAEALASRRRLAEQLMQEGSSAAPVRHWLQGAARVTSGLFGGLEGYRAEESEKARHAEAQKLMSGLMGLGDADAAPTAPAPSVAPSPVLQANYGRTTVPSRITSVESGGDPNAQNPNSSAGGRGQFIDSTWLDVMKRNKPDLVAGKSDADILAMKTGEATAPLQDEMTATYAKEIAASLKAQGIEPTPGRTRLGYFLGPGGAAKVIKSDPNAPLTQILPPEVIAANPQLRTMTSGRAQRWADGQMEGAGASAAPAAAAGADGLPPTSKNPRRMLRQAIALSANPETKHLGDAMLLKYLTEEGKSTDDIREYQLATQQGYKGSFLEWQTKSKFNKSEGGKQPIPLRGPGGKETVGFYQGNAHVEPGTFPEGFEYSPPVTNVETPTAVIQRTRGGTEVGREAKDISAAASQAAQGAAGGSARVAAPGAKTSVDSALALAAELRTHPGLDTATGMSGLFDPRNYIPGTDAADFEKMRGELAAKRFMTAREGLKGAGAVTDFEGEEGGKAIGDLSRAKSKPAFLAALDRVEKMMMASYRDLAKKANLDKVSTQGDAPIEPLNPVQKWERGPDGIPRRVQ